MDIGRLKYTVQVYLQNEIEGEYGSKEVTYKTSPDKSFRASINFNPSSRAENNSQITYDNTVLIYTWQHNVTDEMKGSIFELVEPNSNRYFLASKIIPAMGRNGINYATIEAAEVFYEDINWFSSEVFTANFYVGTTLISSKDIYKGKPLGILPDITGTVEEPFENWIDSEGTVLNTTDEVTGNVTGYAKFTTVEPERTVENILQKMKTEQPELYNSLIAWFDPTLAIEEYEDGYILPDLATDVLNRSGFDLGSNGSYNKIPSGSYDVETGLFSFGPGTNFSAYTPTNVWTSNKTAAEGFECTSFGYFQGKPDVECITKGDLLAYYSIGKSTVTGPTTRLITNVVGAGLYYQNLTYNSKSIIQVNTASYFDPLDWDSGFNYCTSWNSRLDYGRAGCYYLIDNTFRESNEAQYFATLTGSNYTSPWNDIKMCCNITDQEGYEDAYIKMGYFISFDEVLTPEQKQWVWDNMIDPRYYRDFKEPVSTASLSSVSLTLSDDGE